MTEKAPLQLIQEVREIFERPGRHAYLPSQLAAKLAEAERLLQFHDYATFDAMVSKERLLRAAVEEVERDIRAHNWNLDRLISWADALRKALDA